MRGKTEIFFFLPKGRNGVHCGAGNSIMKLLRGRIRQFPVRLRHEPLFCITDQLFCVHAVYLLFVSLFSKLYFIERSSVSISGFIRQSQLLPVEPG